jgi:hypothetical protein
MIDSWLEKGLNCRVLATLLARRMRGSICERSGIGIGVGASEGIAITIADIGSLLGALVALFCLAILIYIIGNGEGGYRSIARFSCWFRVVV